MPKFRVLTAATILAVSCVTNAFAPANFIKRPRYGQAGHVARAVGVSSINTSLAMSDDPLAGMSDERKANLFQSLLRDLQIEGVPLLGCGEFWWVCAILTHCDSYYSYDWWFLRRATNSPRNRYDLYFLMVFNTADEGNMLICIPLTFFRCKPSAYTQCRRLDHNGWN